jgi:MFS family permease
MIVYGGFSALLFSRVLVGLVKQTMTVTTSVLTRCTTEDNRAMHLGRLQSSATAAWIAGPTVGGFLYKYVDHKAPALLACVLFLFNMIVAAVLLRDGDDNPCMERSTLGAEKSKDKQKKSFWGNLKSCFSSPALGSVIASMLIFTWVDRATSYSSMGSYYEDMYGVEPHFRGYIQSYQSGLRFLVQSAFVGPVLKYVGGERRAACLSALVLAIATFWEAQRSFPIF